MLLFDWLHDETGFMMKP